ncbi:hypothetical protein BROUX41_004902 [Berkeleyomyces rouxiae]|uniref:uncharacterized protein n=1 Tax=Berkeleyomyces rouxiae TaxID=2035830 RepID=UPI003B804E8D
MTTAVHPYYPTDLVIDLFQPNTTPLWLLASAFAGLICCVLAGVGAASKRANRHLTTSEMLTVSWFALCAFLHCCFEGYFVLFHREVAGRQDLFAQLWKEYSLSDSRYLVSDPFMVCIETVTVLVWGPLSIAAAAAVVQRSPLRALLSTLVSVGHLYGVVLYFATCFAEQALTGRAHSRPEFLYFWVYFAGCNIPWAIVPSS